MCNSKSESELDYLVVLSITILICTCIRSLLTFGPARQSKHNWRRRISHSCKLCRQFHYMFGKLVKSKMKQCQAMPCYEYVVPEMQDQIDCPFYTLHSILGALLNQTGDQTSSKMVIYIYTLLCSVALGNQNTRCHPRLLRHYGCSSIPPYA